MIPIKDCHFCFQPTTYVPLTVQAGSPVRSRILRVHYCHQCKAEYVFWGDDGAVSTIHLYTIIGSRLYRWTSQPGDNLGRLWYVEHPGIAGQVPNKGLVLVKSFDERPDINPHNVEEKVRLMLTFL